MLRHRRIATCLIVLAVAVAPVTCVCAGWTGLDEAAAATTDTPSDCHSNAPAPEIAGDEACPGCDDGSPADVSKTPSEPFNPGAFVLDFASSFAFAQDSGATPVHRLRQFKRPTPVGLNVVLLN